MLSPTDIVNGLTTEVGGYILISLALAMLKFRTQDAWDSLRGYAIGCHATLLTLKQITPSYLLSPWVWPMFLVIPVGIGMEATRWGGMVELAGGALVMVFLCAAAFLIVKSKLR